MLINVYAIGFVGWAIFFLAGLLPAVNKRVNLYDRPVHYLFAVLSTIIWPVFTVALVYSMIADRTGR